MADETNFDDSSIVIDGYEAHWRINAEGPINGKYIGTFKFRCYLTPTQRIAANREYREMLGSNPTLIPEHEDGLAYALTQLKYRVISYPPFWEGEDKPILGDIADYNIISLVLNASVAAELKYLKQLGEKKKTAIERAVASAEKIYKQQSEENREEKKDESADKTDTDQS
jgi:hypothetical protein